MFISSSSTPVSSTLITTSMPISRFLSSFKSSNEADTFDATLFERVVTRRIEALKTSPSSHLRDAAVELQNLPKSINFKYCEADQEAGELFKLRSSLSVLLGGIHVVFELPNNKLNVIWEDDQVVDVLNDILWDARDTLKGILKHEKIQKEIPSIAFPDEQKFLHWKRLINSYAFRFLCLPIETPVYWYLEDCSLEDLLSRSGGLKGVAEVPLTKEVNRLTRALQKHQSENSRLKGDLASGAEQVHRLNSEIERLTAKNARLWARLDVAQSERSRDTTGEDAPPGYYAWEQYRSPNGSINISNVGNVSNMNAEYYIYRSTN